MPVYARTVPVMERHRFDVVNGNDSGRDGHQRRCGIEGVGRHC